jgi:replication factor C subunit 3/5
VSSIQQAQGLALQDILRDVHGYLGLINFTDEMLILLYKKIAEIEYRLDAGGSDKLQLGALVSVFQIIREEVGKHVDER